MLEQKQKDEFVEVHTRVPFRTKHGLLKQDMKCQRRKQANLNNITMTKTLSSINNLIYKIPFWPFLQYSIRHFNII